MKGGKHPLSPHGKICCRAICRREKGTPRHGAWSKDESPKWQWSFMRSRYAVTRTTAMISVHYRNRRVSFCTQQNTLRPHCAPGCSRYRGCWEEWKALCIPRTRSSWTEIQKRIPVSCSTHPLHLPAPSQEHQCDCWQNECLLQLYFLCLKRKLFLSSQSLHFTANRQWTIWLTCTVGPLKEIQSISR